MDRLEPRPGESLPHVYGDGALCLHLAGEWSSDMLVVDSIIPWTAEWLINYEIWKATGEWHGGGQWPPGEGTAAAPKQATSDGRKSPEPSQSEGRWQPEMRGRRRARSRA
jgi:hypothetical protein